MRHLNFSVKAPLFTLALAAGALLGACDLLDKPIGELAPYEPCADKKCGDTCTVCAPDDPDCVETQVIKACDIGGACVAATPDLCEAPDDDPPADPGHEPCAGKAPCDPCHLCAPDDPDCVETQELKVCDDTLKCVSAIGDLCSDPAPWAPCDGATCGDTCSLCAPNDPDCTEDDVVKACSAKGECVPLVPDLCEPPAYDPCAGKAVCDTCNLCAPNDPDCAEDAVIKVCNFALQCVPLADGVCEPPTAGCEGKACGDACTICAPNDPDCVEDAVIKACTATGECVPDTGDLCL